MSEALGATDRDLVQRTLEGDREAYGEIVRRHQRRVYVTALQLTHNHADADDLCQEVFVKAYRSLGRFDFRSDLFTWLYRITVNTALNFLTRAHRTRTRSLDEDALIPLAVDRLVGDSEDPRVRLEMRQLCRKVVEALDSLKAELRIALTLHTMQGLSHREVAEIMDCAEGTVAWRINEARRQLRQKLRRVLHGEFAKDRDLSRGKKAPFGLS